LLRNDKKHGWTINIYAAAEHKINQLGIKSKPQSNLRS